MTSQARTEALIELIQRRLAAISERQHALALEKSCLLEQVTPLRLGVVAPDTAVIQLKAKGVIVPGLAAAWAADRRPRGPVLRAVVPPRLALASRPVARPESA